MILGRTMHLKRPSREERAFTLIEIMVVIGIVALIMATGIPSIARALSKDDLARAIKDTIEGCKTARDRAILQGVPWAFVVHSESGELRVEPVPQEAFRGKPQNVGDESGTETKSAPPESPYSGFPRKLGEDVMVQLVDVNFVDHMDAPEARVRFFPNGTADEFTIVFAWKGKQRTVTVDIVTGQATEFIQR
jgi:prepilin-type N-terminal cleavage/methylation domain-containing protein